LHPNFELQTLSRSWHACTAAPGHSLSACGMQRGGKGRRMRCLADSAILINVS
jgi:hypothetical protein